MSQEPLLVPCSSLSVPRSFPSEPHCPPTFSFKSWSKYENSETLPCPLYLKFYPLLSPCLTYPLYPSYLCIDLSPWCNINPERAGLLCAVLTAELPTVPGTRWWWNGTLRNGWLVDGWKKQLPRLDSGPQPPLRGGKRCAVAWLHPRGCPPRTIRFAACRSGGVKFTFHEMTDTPVTVVMSHSYKCPHSPPESRGG